MEKQSPKFNGFVIFAVVVYLVITVFVAVIATKNALRMDLAEYIMVNNQVITIDRRMPSKYIPTIEKYWKPKAKNVCYKYDEKKLCESKPWN